MRFIKIESCSSCPKNKWDGDDYTCTHIDNYRGHEKEELLKGYCRTTDFRTFQNKFPDWCPLEKDDSEELEILKEVGISLTDKVGK